MISYTNKKKKTNPNQTKQEFIQFQIVQRENKKLPIVLNSLMSMIYIVLFSLLPNGRDIYPCSKT